MPIEAIEALERLTAEIRNLAIRITAVELHLGLNQKDN